MRRVFPYSTLLLSIIVLCIETAISQNRTQNPDKYKFDHVDIKLDNNRVESILEDSQGYLWIGTIGGLHRYDGVNLKYYPIANDSISLNVSRIEELFEDSKKRLWISTDGGLYIYMRDLDNFRKIKLDDDYIPQSDPSLDRTECIMEDSNGVVWIANERVAIQYYDQGKDKFISYFNDTPYYTYGDEHVKSIVQESENLYWFAMAGGELARMNTSSGEIDQVFRFDTSKGKFSLGEDRLVKLILDKKNRLWLATSNRGIDRLDLNNMVDGFTRYRHEEENPFSLYNNDVVSIYEDSNGNIWVCNENGGLHLFDEALDGFHRFLPDSEDADAISNIAIQTVYEDSENRLWIGSHLEGLDVYDPYLHKFEHYKKTTLNKGLNNNIIRGFHEDAKGNLYIATDGGGLNYFDRQSGKFEYFTEGNSDINSNAVLAIVEGPEDKLWIGTWRGSINIFDPKTKDFSHPYSHIPSTSKVYNIYKSKNNALWVGTQIGGLNCFDSSGSFIGNYVHDERDPKSIGDDSVVDIIEDAEGNYWIGTENDGCSMLIPRDNGTYYFKRYNFNENNPYSIPNDKVNDLFLDDESMLWVATEGGLCLFNKDKDGFENYTISNGLASNNVKSILQDDGGSLWLGTSKSLTRFDKQSGEFRNYMVDDGIQSGEFSRYATLRTSRGELVFGGSEGFNIFYPDSLRDNPFPPKVQLTSLNIMNDEVTPGSEESPLQKVLGMTDHFYLSYEQFIIGFKYIGINFTQSNTNQYAYRLIGFEQNWNQVGDKKEATYMNLEPGDYRFEVKSANNDGLWSEPSGVSFTIIPPWWATWWFRASLAAFVLLAVYSFYQYRTQALRQNQLILERLVKERTYEVDALNRKLAKSNETLTEQKKDLENTVDVLKSTRSKLIISEKMASLGVFTAGIAHEINNPINFISGASQKMFEMFENKLKSNGGSMEETQVLVDLKNAINVGIDRTTKIVNSLKNYSKHESSAFEHYDIVQCLEDSLLILSHQLNLSKIEVKKIHPEQLMVNCLPGKISQVFVNLLSNAVDAVKEEGQIKVTIQKKENEVAINISDDGPGIPQDEVPKLFDPFYSTKDIGQGTGLGLYIVYGIVEEHQGKVDVKSGKNGTTFKISLPLSPEAVRQKAEIS